MPNDIETPEPCGRRVDALVGQFRKDVYDELFELLRMPQKSMDSLEAKAGRLTDRIVAYARPLLDQLQGDPLSIFTWLDNARFVPDKDGGHIEFAGKTFRVDRE